MSKLLEEAERAKDRLAAALREAEDAKSDAVLARDEERRRRERLEQQLGL